MQRRYVKGVLFTIRKYTRGLPFLSFAANLRSIIKRIYVMSNVWINMLCIDNRYVTG